MCRSTCLAQEFDSIPWTFASCPKKRPFPPNRVALFEEESIFWHRPTPVSGSAYYPRCFMANFLFPMTFCPTHPIRTFQEFPAAAAQSLQYTAKIELSISIAYAYNNMGVESDGQDGNKTTQPTGNNKMILIHKITRHHKVREFAFKLKIRN